MKKENLTAGSFKGLAMSKSAGGKKAFTLAEVLLTLAIIGVVAALTIPAVITKVTQDQYVVGLKKAYNTLKSVEREAIQTNGEMQNWRWAGNLADFDKYFKPHFDILKDCGTATDAGCFADEYLEISGSNLSAHLPAFNDGSTARIITSDGISYAYQPVSQNNIIGYFHVDVNGKKPPNRFGRDTFTFQLYKPELDLGLKPNGVYTAAGTVHSTNTMNSNCKATGLFCTAKVLAEGAMNY